MKYCIQCLQPDTRPNTCFTEAGLCPACDYSGHLPEVDWQERFALLQDLLARYQRKPGQDHDCIIGVSGGKDSTRQALWVRDKLGRKPLLACLSYPPEQVTQRGVDNISNLLDLGFDLVLSAPAPGSWKQLMRLGFERFGNWARSTELALFSAVPQLAIRYGIQLIFWGENPALQLGDLQTLGRSGYDGNRLRYMNTLAGGSMEWLLESGLSLQELIPYQYPNAEEFERHGLQIVYLGWFLGDWSLANNGMIAAAQGLHIRDDSAANTGDLWGVTSLDEDWVTLNQMIKFYKYGFGRATDYVNEEIRSGRISRTEGIALVQAYDGVCGESYIDSFCNYIGIDRESFQAKLRACYNRELFTMDGQGGLHPRFKVGVGL